MSILSASIHRCEPVMQQTDGRTDKGEELAKSVVVKFNYFKTLRFVQDVVHCGCVIIIPYYLNSVPCAPCSVSKMFDH